MATFILLNEEEADHVRGPMLQPIARQNDVFILNTLVLDDPTHEEHHDYLAALPTMDMSDPDFPPEIETEEV